MGILFQIVHFYFQWKRSYILKNQYGFRQKTYKSSGFAVCTYTKEPDSGTAKETLIFLHGILDSSYGFRKIAPFLSHHYRLIFLDVPGFGKSKIVKIDYLYRIPVIADLLREQLDAIFPEPAILVGHSMGGLICQHIALQSPVLRWKKLVLLSPGGIPHPEREKIRNILFPKSPNEFQRLLQSLYYQNFPEPSPFAMRLLVWLGRGYGYSTLTKNTLAEEHKVFFGKSAKGILQPTLILSGLQDEITPKKSILQLSRYIRNSRCVFLDKARHAIHLEFPDKVAQEILLFLK